MKDIHLHLALRAFVLFQVQTICQLLFSNDYWICYIILSKLIICKLDTTESSLGLDYTSVKKRRLDILNYSFLQVTSFLPIDKASHHYQHTHTHTLPRPRLHTSTFRVGRQRPSPPDSADTDPVTSPGSSCNSASPTGGRAPPRTQNTKGQHTPPRTRHTKG
jgi:hypothetical protein